MNISFNPVPKPSKKKKRRPVGHFSQKVRKQTAKEQGGRCFLCEREIQQFHHAVPKGMGGTNDPELGERWNCFGLCLFCHAEVERNINLRRRLREIALIRKEGKMYFPTEKGGIKDESAGKLNF